MELISIVPSYLCKVRAVKCGLEPYRAGKGTARFIHLRLQNVFSIERDFIGRKFIFVTSIHTDRQHDISVRGCSNSSPVRVPVFIQQ